METTYVVATSLRRCYVVVKKIKMLCRRCVVLNIIKNAYMEIDNTVTDYAGDNLDDLNALPAEKKRAFQLARFQLSKVALDREISFKDIREAFSDIF